ncbi:MAG: response regulator [Nitrospinota bacterium]
MAEDDAGVLKYMSRILSRNGFDVLEVTDGKSAIEQYKEKSHLIDAIVSDLRMPHVSGLQFAKYNYDNDNLPFIICTAFNDATMALNLLEVGARDYIAKPIDKEQFIRVVKNAINRSFKKISEVGFNPYEGNVGSITISSRKNEINYASDWVGGQVENILDKYELGLFMNFIGEFLLNAFEHGNLGIREKEKSKLLEEGNYESEIARRETGCKAKITVSVSALESEIAVNIADEGDGFDYEKYLNMSENVLSERLDMPNGRGVQMSKNYFDSIEYKKGGANVLLTKII